MGDTTGMRDSTIHEQPTLPIEKGHSTPVAREYPAQDTLATDSVFPHSQIVLDELYTWIYGVPESAKDSVSNGPNAVRGLFAPPLPTRTWNEKQYQALPMRDRWFLQEDTTSLAFAFILLAALFAMFLRFRFWKYYSDYRKLFFHPRSLLRLSEWDEPHPGQFHFYSDVLVIILLSLQLWWSFRLPFFRASEFPVSNLWLLPMVFVGFLILYAYKIGLLHLASRLIRQPEVAHHLWRQHNYVHRVLWPYYFAIVFLSMFNIPWLQVVFIYAGVLLIFATWLYGLFRVLLTFIYFRYNLFFYFLYLCALEIGPFLGLIRWLELE